MNSFTIIKSLKCPKLRRANALNGSCETFSAKPVLKASEHNSPRYILDLVLSSITVSLKTLDIVESLPEVDFGS